jgi:hypothetical protein
MEELNLSDLLKVKSILENKLENKRQQVKCFLGRDYERYHKVESAYIKDENHNRLKRVNEQIENIINSI